MRAMLKFGLIAGYSEGKPRIHFGDGPVSSRSRFAHGFLGFCTSEKKNSELDLWATTTTIYWYSHIKWYYLG